ncbi:MAG TPA: branched-chain amino acid ABC transporter ATP-binding protein/permease [Methylomirabilota bacterium]|nr:branched-chain amino acid ABC transporter ATP-binding protein/permease [Methylomirabilota bacterium]
MKGLALAAVILATAPLYADYTPFYLGLLTEVLVFGLFALAYDVLLGNAGVLSLGHSAFLGVAAYTTGIMLGRLRLPLELSVLTGALGGVLTALVVGTLVLRKRGVYLAMLTLALSQIFYYVVLMWTPVTGGTDGLGNLPILHLGAPLGLRLSKRPVTRYYVVVAIIFAAVLVVRHILHSPLGRAMRAVKANERRAEACGYNARRVKLAAFVISGFFSGLAGALLTVVLEFVPIENIHWAMSGTVLIMTLFGGTGTLLGPFVGAGVFVWMRDFLSKYLEYWEVFVGGAFVLIVLFFPEGIVGTALRVWRQRRAETAPVDETSAPAAERVVPARVTGDDGQPLLQTVGLTKRFGGLIAVNRVDFAVRRGELRAVIGPNGAGKTTFFNVLTGVLPSSAGRILFKGRDVSGLPAHALSRLGIARSYQVTNIFGDLTVFENLRIAAQSRVTQYRAWGNADRLQAVNARADETLRLLGLAAKRHVRAAELSHGEQRYLEIGIALATDPEFLLLDEPTAGMSPEETQRTAAFVRKLAGRVTIVLVEHDMEVVMGVSDRITVLNYGEILAEGTPAEIRDNADVRRVYLRD